MSEYANGGTVSESYIRPAETGPICPIPMSSVIFEEQKLTFVKLVRCKDCSNASFDEFGGGWCSDNCREIKPWNFCCWGDGGDAE